MDEAIYCTIEESETFGLFVIDANGCCSYANLKYRHITGLPLEELIGHDWKKPLHAQDRERMSREMFPFRCLPYTTTVRYSRPDGSEMPATLHLSVIEENGQPPAYLATVIDHTEQQQLEAELDTTNITLHAVLESTSAGIFSLDTQLNYIAFNKAHQKNEHRLWGINIQPGDNYMAIRANYHGPDKDQAFALLNRALKGEQIQTSGYFFGSYYDATCNPIYDSDGHITGVAVFTQDNTSRMQQLQENMELSRLLNGLLDHLPMAMYKINGEGIITLSTGSALNFIGLPAEMFLGKNVMDLFPAAAAPLQKAMAGEQVQFVQSIEKDGQVYYFQNHVFPDPAVPHGVTGFALDITHDKLVEQEIRKAKQAAEAAAVAKQQFLSTMSHEIRTPMNAIIGTTYLLLQENPRPDQEENLKTLQFSAENLLALINDILDFSKIEAGKIAFEHTDFNIKKMLSHILRAHRFKAQQKGIRLHTQMAPGLPEMLIGDSVRLTQVLNNLLGNAIKFTEQGSVTLRMDFTEQDAATICLHVSVSDTGIGIAPEMQEQIFDSFTQGGTDTTRRFGGTGLGLAITRQLLQLQGSQIRLSSTPGQGATFSFDLTLKRSLKSSSDIKPVYSSAAEINYQRFKGHKILLTDDNEVNLRVAAQFMKKWGLEVTYAKSGPETLDRLAETMYDMVLLDLQMPGMSGYETTRRIRALPGQAFQRVPVIAITADVMPEVKERIIAAGMNDYIFKPFNPHELYGKIACYLQAG